MPNASLQAESASASRCQEATALEMVASAGCGAPSRLPRNGLCVGAGICGSRILSTDSGRRAHALFELLR